MKQLLRNYCNTKLNRTVSQDVSSAGKATIFSPEDIDSMFIRNVCV
jgi:hypothetical protein